MPRGFALTAVNWMYITMSWTLSMKWDYFKSREKDYRNRRMEN